MDRINRIQNNMNNNLNNQGGKMPLALAKLNELYSEFSQKMDKSDFCNSPRRYIAELGYVQNLKKTSESYNFSAEAEKWDKKEQEIRAKLAEFGIKIND